MNTAYIYQGAWELINDRRSEAILRHTPCHIHKESCMAQFSGFPVLKDARNTGHKPLWNEIKFIDRDPYYYTRRVKEAIHIRLNPDNINWESGKEIPEAWMPTIKKQNNRRAVRQWTAEGANHWMNEQGSKCTNQSCWKTTNHSRASCFIRPRTTSRPIARRRLAVCSRNVAIYITRDYIVSQTKNLAFIVIHHDE